MSRGNLTSAVLCTLIFLPRGFLHAQGQPCFRCPVEATSAVFELSASAYHVAGTNLAVVGSEGVGPSERIRIAGTLSYNPEGGRDPTGVQQVGAAFWGGGLTISTLSGSFSQDVTPAGGGPIIGPTAPGVVNGVLFSACVAPPGLTLSSSWSGFTTEFDIGAHPMDIVDGYITFVVRYTNGTAMLPNSLGQCPAGELSQTTFVQVPVGEGSACASPGVNVSAAVYVPRHGQLVNVSGAAIASCEPIMVNAILSYNPGLLRFQGVTNSSFSGGNITVFTASGSFYQDVTPFAGVPVIGPATRSDCGPPVAGDRVLGFTSLIDPTTLASEIDPAGFLTFFVRYGPAGTVGHVGRDVRDVLSMTTSVRIGVAPPDYSFVGCGCAPFCEVPCGTPLVLVNGGCSPSNYFRFPATNSVSVAIYSEMRPEYPGLSNLGRIHYTLDGLAEPDVGADEYLGPFAITNSVTVWAKAFSAGWVEALADKVVIELVPIYPFELGTRGGGTVSADPPGGQYLSNSVMTLTASPAPGWGFVRWDGFPGNTNRVLSVTNDRGRSIQAVFGTSITTTKNGPGHVTLDPAQGPYPFGSTVRISAVPSNSMSYFDGWTNNNEVVSPWDFVVTNARPAVRAVFGTLPTNVFALNVLVNGNGSVTKSPQIPRYIRGTNVTLAAVANSGETFFAWTGDAVGSQNPLIVTMDRTKTITANFSGGTNRPPLVRIFSPTDSQIFERPPASLNVSVEAYALGAEATLVKVELYDGATLLGTTTNAPFNFTWTGPAPGEHILTAVATDNTGQSTTSEPVRTTIQALPTFSFDPASYSVHESSNAVTVRVIKNAGTAAATVRLLTYFPPGSARAPDPKGGEGDFIPVDTNLVFTANEESQTVTIRILDDYYSDGTVYFRLSLKGGPNTSVSNDTAFIYIVDNDGPTNSFPVRRETPVIDRGSLHTLVVNLLQTNQQPVPDAQWRFTWEFNWRTNGSVATGLPAGNYEVEFKPVPGYIEPPREIVSLTTDTDRTFHYTNTTVPQLGSLTVVIEPPFIATNNDPNFQGGWRLDGDQQGMYRDSGTTVHELSAASYLVEFKTITNRWTTPAPRQVSVSASRMKTITERYYVADLGPGRGIDVLDFAQVNGAFESGLPYVFCGQLLSDIGYGSGCAVKERVVLTAAHMVFDGVELKCVTGVNWFFQRHAGVYEPPPKPARGWVKLDGYAAAKTNDPIPGISSVASKNRDVAALYFASAVAGGGFSGYLVSHPQGNEWLFNSATQMLVGYPVQIVPEQNRGRMHATPIQSLTWNYETNQVFYTTNIAGYPGMSGGPLCVTSSNTFYPAAVFLGGNDRTTVRVIDGEVAELINTAQGLGDSGEDHTGPIRLGISGRADTDYQGLVNVYLLPPDVTNYGAGYRFTSATANSDWYDEQFARFKDYSGKSYNVEFMRLTNPFFMTPTNAFVTFDKSQQKLVFGVYQAWGALTNLFVTNNTVQLRGSSGSVYRVEYTPSLGSAVGWSLLETPRLNGSLMTLTNILPPGTTNGFLRAVLRP